ncbi:hypothetical protein EMILIAHAH_176 [Bacillus phage vB_BanH_Emiliahah]|nr:hypothetical protein EMILIAHAH_176 [Bacillus phage vB_BanH_Emiliahah]
MIRVAIEYLTEEGELTRLQKMLPYVPNSGHFLETKGTVLRIISVSCNVDSRIVTLKAEEVG